MSGTVSLSNVGQVAHILIDDIPNYNAMTLQMWHEMAAAITSINENADVRVAVIRGAGDRAFV